MLHFKNESTLINNKVSTNKYVTPLQDVTVGDSRKSCIVSIRTKEACAGCFTLDSILSNGVHSRMLQSYL